MFLSTSVLRRFRIASPAAAIILFTVPTVRTVLSVLCALVSVWRMRSFEFGKLGGKQLPRGQGGGSAKLIFLTTDEMTFGKEVVGDVGVDRGELL